VCVAGMPSRRGAILSVIRDGERRIVEIEITGWKKKPDARRHPQFAGVPAAADSSLEGEYVTLLPSSLGRMSRLKRKRVRDEAGPGAWVTHGAGRAPRRGRRIRGDLLAEVEKLRRARK
jgi:hypothetical protein